MLIKDLLHNCHYRGNQTLLSEKLNINRGTLRKFMNDNDDSRHFIRVRSGKVEFFTNQSNKV
jgi:hypothetical protein